MSNNEAYASPAISSDVPGNVACEKMINFIPEATIPQQQQVIHLILSQEGGHAKLIRHFTVIPTIVVRWPPGIQCQQVSILQDGLLGRRFPWIESIEENQTMHTMSD